MKRTARNILLIVVAVLLLTAFAGCKQETPVASGSLQVNTIKIMPYAYMGEEFDLRDVLLMEEGVDYSATACYVDLDTMTEYALEVNDLRFTPVAVRETVVVLTAKRGSESASKVIYIPTTIRAEPLDDLYKSSGTLGGSDPGISKTVNIDPLYLQGDESTTSLHVSFNSTDPHPYGNLFMSFSAEEAQQYFTDQVWENAIVTFWVYNPNELPIEFQLRIVDETAGTNLDWQTVDGPHKQRAEPGQWTQIFFSLRKLGTTNRLTGGKYTNDMCSLKFRYDGYSTTEAYSFDFYMDNIDVVDASMYPEIDTKYVLSNETIEQGWENMAMDTGWQGVYTEYDYEFIQGEGSTCSLKAYFNSEKSLTNSFICLSPEAEFDENPDMTGGILSGYFKFEGLDPKVSVDIVNKSWATSNRVDMNLQALGDGWYYGTLDLEQLQVGTGRNDEIIRIRLNFSGVTNDSIVYVDTLLYEYKYVEKVLEYADTDLINMSLDTGSYYNNLTYSFVTSPIIGSNTVRSLKLVAPANTDGRFTWNTDAAASNDEIASTPNMSYGTLGAWFYFGKQLPNASFQVTSDNWKGSTAIPFVFTKNNGDGWYYGELHGSDIKFVEDANANAVIRWTLIIPAGYTVYVDNLSWTTSYENTLVAAEIDSSVLYDGGDLLAGTDKISYDKRHWENVENTDDFDQDGVADPDLTKGLTCGVDTENVYGEYSVRSWYFKAAADNNYASAVAQLQLAKGYDMTGKNLAFDIKIDTDSKVQQTIGLRLQSTGWSNINEQNVTVKLNPGDWRTVVVDFSDVLLENADVANLGFISFYFDFAANTGFDRAIYIDNVRLTTDAATGDEEPLPLGPEDQYDGGDMLANTDALTYNKVHWENVENTDDFDGDGVVDPDVTKGLTCGVDTKNVYGKYSVRSWYFKAAASNNFGSAVAQLQLAQSYNMTGKNLAFDIKIDTDSKVQQTIGLRLQSAGWSNINEQNVTVKLNPGDWRTVVVDFSDVLLENADVANLGFISFYFDFAANTGYDRAIYIDNVRLTTDAATGDDEPLPLGPEDQYDGGDMLANTDALTYNKVHWENVENTDDFDGDGVVDPDVTKGLTCGVDTENVYGDYSVRSWYFKAAASNNFGSAVAQLQLAQSYNMTGKNLAFDIKIDTDSKVQQTIGLRLQSAGWSNINEQNVTVKLNPGDWRTVVVDFSDVLLENADVANLGFISFYFDFAANTGYDRAIYIDNVRLTTDAATGDDEPLPLGPEDQYDGGDMLANTNTVIYDKTHWDNIENSDDDRDGEIDADKTSGLTTGVNTDASKLCGEHSVRNWYFKASAANNFGSAIAQLQLAQTYDLTGKNLAFDILVDTECKFQQPIGIRLNNSGWKNINEQNVNIKVNPGQWKHVVVSFDDVILEGVDITTLGFISFYFDFAATSGYDRTIYIDNVTLTTDAPTAQEEPLVKEDNAQNDWTNMVQDSGEYYCNVESEIKTDKIKGEISTKSLYVKAPADAAGKLTFNTSYAVEKGELDSTPNMNAGTLGAWFYFGDAEPSATVKVTESFGWKGSAEVPFVFGECEDGWYYGTVDCASITYSETSNPGYAIRVTIGVPAGFEGYIDSMTFEPGAVSDPIEPETTEPETTEPLEEDPNDLLANAQPADEQYIFNSSMGYIFDSASEVVSGTESTRSWMFSAPETVGGWPTALVNLNQSVDMSGKVLAMDVKVTGGASSLSVYAIYNSGWSCLNAADWPANYTKTEFASDEWVTLYFDLSEKLGEGKDLTDVKFIKLGFNFETNKGVEQIVYIDNVRLADPSEMPVEPTDENDMLTGTNNISYNKKHWENWDDSEDEVEAVSGLTCGVDTENVYGDQSIRSWYFKASADASIKDAVAQLGLDQVYDITGMNLAFDIKIDTDSKLQQAIEIRLHNSGWGNLNDTNAIVKLNPGDWRTVVVSFEDLFNADADLTDLKMISFYFDFASNTGKDRAIYIDNVRLTTDAATGDDEPLPLGPEDLYDGGDLLAGTDTIEYHRNHWENVSNTHDLDGDGQPDAHLTEGLTVGVDETHLNGQYSVRSWYFKAVANANFNNATAQFALANTLDISNKKLSFDVYYDADTKVQQSIRVRLHSKSTGDMFVDQTVKVNPGAWKTVVMDFSGTLLDGKTATDLKYISFYFDFAANSGKERTVYIDNVQLVDMSVPTVGSDEPLPLGPEDQYDGGDLLANATAADSTGIFAEDMFSYDANSTNVYSTGDVGAYSVKSWKFTAAAGESGTPTALIMLPDSVDMTGKVLALDAYIENGNGSLSIYTIHNSGWAKLNASETAANYRNETITGQWVTLYYDLGSKLAEGNDLTDVKFIKFQFSFKENLTVEQNVYIDNVRLVDPEDVPPADDVALDWTNMTQDKGVAVYHNMLTNEFSGEYTKGESSIKSLHLVAPADTEGRFTLHTELAKINGDLEELPNLYGGMLGAWFYFGENEPSAKLQVTEAGWKSSVTQSFTFTEGEDGWYYGTVDGSQITFAETNTPGLPIRITITLPAGFDGYIDSMTMTDTETVKEDWIKMQRDAGQTNVETALEYSALKAENSIQSLYVKAPTDAQGVLVLNTEAAFGKNYDMSSGELGAWFYFGEQEAEAYLKLNGNDKASNEVAFDFVAGDEGWAYGVVDMYDITYAEADGTSANALRVSVLIPAGYTVYIDGMTYDANAATIGSEKASDLLGAATADAENWTQSNGLTVTQDSVNTVGGLSVLSWSFKANAAVNTTETVQFTFADSVNMTGKYLVFDAKSEQSQDIMIQLWNADGNHTLTEVVSVSVAAADWTSYVLDFNDSVWDNMDLTAVGGISFFFDFASNTGSERSLNIDNVHLVDAETADQDWIHKEQITEEGYKTAELSLSNVFVKADESSVSLKVEAPADAVGKFTLDTADGMKHRGTLSAWFYFGEQVPSAGLTTRDSAGLTSQEAAFTFGENQDGWYLGTVDLSKMSYQIGASSNKLLSMTFAVPAGYTVYVDGLTYADITETAADDLINLSSEKYNGDGSYAYSDVKVKDDNSVRSLYAVPTVAIDFTLEEALDLSNSTFSCWLYYGETAPDANSVRFTFFSGNTNTGALSMTIESTGVDGWYKATLDTSAFKTEKQAPLASVDKIRIQFRNHETYMDYLMYEKNETAE